jgi:hypothetical protein
LNPTTDPAGRFFERRRSVMTRAFGSPNTPRTMGRGRNTGKAYASRSRRFRLAALIWPSEHDAKLSGRSAGKNIGKTSVIDVINA